MTYYLPMLWRSIYDRLNNDTGSGGLRNGSSPLVTGISAGTQYADQPLPHIAFECGASQPDDAFDTRGRSVVVSVHVWVAAEDPSGEDPYAKAAAILERVMGNWPKGNTPSTPDYGLDRWQPTYTTPWSGTILTVQTEEPAHEDGKLHWILNFEARAYVS